MPAPVQQNSGTTGTGTADPIVVTLPSGVAAGNTLVVAIIVYSVAITTPSGWTLDRTQTTHSASPLAVYSRPTVAGETSWSFELPSANVAAWWVEELGGAWAADVVNSATSGLSTATSQATGSVTPTVATTHLVAAVAAMLNPTPGTFAGWTTSFTEQVDVRSSRSGVNVGIGVATRDVTVSAAYSTTATISTGSYSSGVIVAYKATAPPIVDKAASDSASVSLTDAGAVLVELRAPSAAESPSVSLTETTALLKTVPKDAADTLTVSVDDSGFVGVPTEIVAADTLAVSADDTTTVSKPLDKAAADSLTTALDDAAVVQVLLRGLTAADSLAVALDDAGTPQVVLRALSAADVLTLTGADSAVLLRGLTAADTLSVSTVETSARATVGPVTGTRVSPPLALPDGPVTASRVSWTATTGAGTVTVETSIDGGTTWQAAVNGSAVAGLAVGAETPASVLTRATLTRPLPEDASPRLHRLEVAVSVASVQVEWVPQGVFGLKRCHITDGPDGLRISLDAYDRSRRVSRNKWEQTFIIAGGTNISDAVRRILLDRLPGLPLDLVSTTAVTPATPLMLGEQSGNDPFADAQDLARAVGMDLFLDGIGRAVMRPTPDPDLAPVVWEFLEGLEATLLDIERDLDDEDAISVMVVLGEGTGQDAPIRGIASDDNPASPTYAGGRFGRVTDHYSSPLIPDEPSAVAAARSLLDRRKGASEQVALTAVVHPALEVDDVVHVRRARLQVDARYIIDQLAIPLSPTGRMSASMRKRRT